jgi:hypothetical protein
MINSIYKGFIAETQKAKGTFTFWFTILGSLLIPFVFFLVYFFRPLNFILPESINPWDAFIQSNLKAIAFLLFPLHVILTIAININIEHKENSWKKLFVLPIKRESIYISKLIFLLFQVFISLLIFSLSMFLFGVVLGFVHNELNFLNYSPAFSSYSKLIIRLFISILGIFSIQYFLSLFFKNIIVPISLGVFLTIVATIIVQGWEHSIYFPYAFPMWFFLNTNQLAAMDTFYGLTLSEITSFATFISVNILGIIVFKSKKIK